MYIHTYIHTHTYIYAIHLGVVALKKHLNYMISKFHSQIAKYTRLSNQNVFISDNIMYLSYHPEVPKCR